MTPRPHESQSRSVTMSDLFLFPSRLSVVFPLLCFLSVALAISPSILSLCGRIPSQLCSSRSSALVLHDIVLFTAFCCTPHGFRIAVIIRTARALVTFLLDVCKRDRYAALRAADMCALVCMGGGTSFVQCTVGPEHADSNTVTIREVKSTR